MLFDAAKGEVMESPEATAQVQPWVLDYLAAQSWCARATRPTSSSSL